MKKLYSYLPYALIDGFVQLLTQCMSSSMDCAITTSNLNSLIQKKLNRPQLKTHVLIGRVVQLLTSHPPQLMPSLVDQYNNLHHVLIGGILGTVSYLMSSLVTCTITYLMSSLEEFLLV